MIMSLRIHENNPYQTEDQSHGGSSFDDVTECASCPNDSGSDTGSDRSDSQEYGKVQDTLIEIARGVSG